MKSFKNTCMNKVRYYINSIKKTKNAKEEAKFYKDCSFSNGFVGLSLDFISKDEWNKILLDADEICNGYIQIYNYPSFMLKDWLVDPITLYRIPKSINCSFIRTSSLIGKVDVKNYWEMGHLHAVFTLAEAYWYTKEEKYARQAMEIILSFINANPCGKTIQWKCIMDVSIRAANISQASYLICDSKAFIDNCSRIAESLAEHILYISSNYENLGERPNNHYLSDLTGVIVAGVFLTKCFPEYQLIQKIINEAINNMNDEVSRQINPDGADYENSSYYHCFVTELCCAVLNTLKTNSFPVTAGFERSCERMVGQCEWLGAFDNRLPLIGDQDGSRLFLATGYFDVDRCDFSYLSRIGVHSEVPEANPASNGISKMQNGKLIVYVKCGEIGTDRKGVHDHNDQLSLTVFYNEKPIIIDCGTFLYTKDPRARKKYRSTSSHSTLVVETLEQNDIDSGMFYIKNGVSGKSITSGNDSFHGRFKYKNGITHDRIIETSKNEIAVYDHVFPLQVPAHIQYLLPEEVTVSHVETNRVQCLTESASIVIDFNTEVVIQDINYSTAYGVEKKGHIIKTCRIKDTTITKLSFFSIIHKNNEAIK